MEVFSGNLSGAGRENRLMQDFKKLKVWVRSQRVVVQLYNITAKFSASERYGLTDQLRRASVSIPANIAEGCGRGSDRDFCRFLYHAMGSACEVECLLILSHDLEQLRHEDYETLISSVREVKRMLSSLIKKIGAS